MNIIEDSFMEAKQIQWAAFKKRLKQDDVPDSFREIVSLVEKFLLPVAFLLSSGQPILKNWKAPERWD